MAHSPNNLLLLIRENIVLARQNQRLKEKVVALEARQKKQPAKRATKKR